MRGVKKPRERERESTRIKKYYLEYMDQVQGCWNCQTLSTKFTIVLTC